MNPPRLPADFWPEAAGPSGLPQAGAVDVWLVRLDELPPADAGPPLSDDERDRAARLKLDAPRQAFLHVRRILRTLLGGYLGVPPADLRFRTEPRGKPTLAEPACDLRFNVSHTAGRALLAFAVGREVGVDVETIEAGRDHAALARRYFSPNEVAALEALPAGQQRLAFYLAWTRKEAFLKARGDGLYFPLDQFDVSLDPAAPAELLAVRPDAAEAARWQLVDLPVGPGHSAALAAEAPVAAVRRWRWAGGPGS